MGETDGEGDPRLLSLDEEEFFLDLRDRDRGGESSGNAPARDLCDLEPLEDVVYASGYSSLCVAAAGCDDAGEDATLCKGS